MRRFRTLAIATVVASLVPGATAAATAPTIEPGGAAAGGIVGSYPAGVACEFPVSFEIVSGGEGRFLTFVDGDGEVTRLMNIARPSTWRFTNLASGESTTVRIVGGLTRITFAPDGTTTVTLAGGIIGFNSPADTPPGPFALAITGRLIFVIAPDGTGTIAQLSGTVLSELCSAVA